MYKLTTHPEEIEEWSFFKYYKAAKMQKNARCTHSRQALEDAVSAASSMQEHHSRSSLNCITAVSFFEQETTLRSPRKLSLPSPTGVCPVKELMYGSHSFPPHRGNITTRHDGVIHA